MSGNIPATTEKPDGPKRVTKRIRAAIDAMVFGEAQNITQAAKVAGLSREHLSKELNRPHISAFLQDKVRRNLAVNSAKAGATKVELLDSENEMVRDRASSFVLGLAGIAPATSPSVSLNMNIRAGYMIDLSERTGPPMRIIGPVGAEGDGDAGLAS